jgi:MFS family permease
MLWARIADTRGRRFCILFGLLVSALSNLAFGFSKSFWTLMFWRTLAGVANGNVGVMRTMTAEIVKTRKYQTKAFLLLPLVFNSGMVFGLALGGLLADPVSNMSWFFGVHGLFNFGRNPQGVEWTLKYPYALPAIFNFTVLGLCLILAVLGLRETLSGREDKSDSGIRLGRSFFRLAKQLIFKKHKGEYTALAFNDLGDSTETPHEEVKHTAALRQVTKPGRIWTRDVQCALVSFGLLPLHNAAYMHLFPVHLSSPPVENTKASVFFFNGGLGLHSPSIGFWLGVAGTCGILLQLFIYPRFQVWVGTLGVFRTSLFIFPAIYILAPYALSLAPRHGFPYWICIALAQILARTLAIPSTVILLTNSAPTKGALSRIHGAGNSLSSLARAIGPVVGGWVFAWGMDHDMIGAVWWFYLALTAMCALWWSYTMREMLD